MGELTGSSFEIVKNCSGTLVRPNISIGKAIDSKLLLKFIALGGCVYIRLLEELETSSNAFDLENEIPMENTIFSPEIDSADDNLIAAVDFVSSKDQL